MDKSWLKSPLIALCLTPGAALAADPSEAMAQSAQISACRDANVGHAPDASYVACLEAAILALEAAAPALSADSGADNAPSLASTSEGTSSASSDAQAADTVSGLGAEQVLAKRLVNGQIEEREERQESSTIVDFATTSTGRLLIFLENGQVWRQKSSDGRQVFLSKRRDYTAVVKDGVVSGYRMTIPEASRTIGVERLK